MQKIEPKIKQRKAVDFGFNIMQYEDPSSVHSTNLVWNLDENQAENLTLRELILATRVSSNSRKSLTLTKNGETVRLNFLKRL
jgi:tRNA splicing endonuclease